MNIYLFSAFSKPVLTKQLFVKVFLSLVIIISIYYDVQCQTPDNFNKFMKDNGFVTYWPKMMCENVYRVDTKDKKSGLIDYPTLEIKVPAQYNFIKPIGTCTYYAGTLNSTGDTLTRKYFTIDNQTLLPDDSKILSYKNKKFTIKTKTGKYAVYSNTGKQIIAPCDRLYDLDSRPDELQVFMGAYALTFTDNNGALTDTNGTIVYRGIDSIECDYQHQVFIDQLAIVYKNGKAGIINQKGQVVLNFEYDQINRCIQIESFRFNGQPNGSLLAWLFAIKKGNKVGTADKTGKIIIPVKYDDFALLTPYDEKYQAFDWNGNAWFRDGEKAGLFNINGQAITPLKYTDYKFFREKIAPVAVKINDQVRWGYINTEGKEITEIKYIEADPCKNKLAVVQNESKMFGYIDMTGKEVVPPQYVEARELAEGMGIVKSTSSLYGVVNQQGELVAPAIYRDIKDYDKGLAAVQDDKSGLWGYIDKSGKVVADLIYKQISEYSDGVATVQDGKSGLWGYIDKSGKVVADLIYKQIIEYDDGLAAVQDGKSGLWGYIDKSGKVVVDLIYKQIREYSIEEELAAVQHSKSEKWGFIDKSGKIVIKLKYDKVSDFYYGIAEVCEKGKCIYINRWGDEDED